MSVDREHRPVDSVLFETEKSNVKTVLKSLNHVPIVALQGALLDIGMTPTEAAKFTKCIMTLLKETKNG